MARCSIVANSIFLVTTVVKDEDVAGERKRVMSKSTSEEGTVIIKHLVKVCKISH